MIRSARKNRKKWVIHAYLTPATNTVTVLLISRHFGEVAHPFEEAFILSVGVLGIAIRVMVAIKSEEDGSAVPVRNQKR